jgi:uncharacterized membrane protein YwzB
MINGQAVIMALIYLICMGLIFWLLWWLLNYINPPEPFKKIGNAILAIAAVVILIGILLGMAGHPIIKW